MAEGLELHVRHERDRHVERGEPLLERGEHVGAVLADLLGDGGALHDQLVEDGVEHVEEGRQTPAHGEVDALHAERDRQAGVGDHDEVGVPGLGDHP